MRGTVSDFYPLFLKYHQKFYSDTRSPQTDAIFFAIKGQRFNGNNYVQKALDDGSPLVLTDSETFLHHPKCFVVSDTSNFLIDLANHHRQNIQGQIIGITGSNGKTTTKDLISRLLSQKYTVHKTQKNLNNHLGVPFTLLSCDVDVDFVILEMGANHPNEIEELCQIAEPDHGIITNIGKAHLEGFGSKDGIFQAKKKLYDAVKKKGGVCFIDRENTELFEAYFDYENAYVYSSEKEACNVFATLKSHSIQGITIEISPNNKKPYEVFTPIFGVYNLKNILAAVSIAEHFNVSSQEIKEGASCFRTDKLRSNLIKTKNNTIFLDCYNANPTSMLLSITSFKELFPSNAIYILGDMKEIGQNAAAEHQRVLDVVSDVPEVYSVGEIFGSLMNHPDNAFKDVQELKHFFTTQKPKNVSLFIKGSRSNALEKLVEVL